jgi:hypothetical protein
MGDTHFTSNILANSDYSSLSISGFNSISATSLSGNITSDTSVKVSSESGYFALGDHVGIFCGGLGVEASIVAAATALIASPIGSLYLNTDGDGLWYFDSNTTATNVTLY